MSKVKKTIFYLFFKINKYVNKWNKNSHNRSAQIVCHMEWNMTITKENLKIKHETINTRYLIYKCMLSHIRLFVTTRTVGHQAPLSTGFSRQEYWSGLLFPLPGDLSNPGIEPISPVLQVDSLPTEYCGSQGMTEISTTVGLPNQGRCESTFGYSWKY